MSAGREVRTTKGYIAVFICLAVKAIHLEVSSLTTDAFIAALTRFISRRETVKHLYSDNVTIFVVAFRKLSRVEDKLGQLDLEWSIIPPRAPPFGGLWEAGVSQSKHTSFTFEEFQTILSQTDATLNSRPLCPLNDDVSSLDVLTPQHFLTGHQFVPLPEDNFQLKRPGLLRRWELIKQIYQDMNKFQTEIDVMLNQQRPILSIVDGQSKIIKHTVAVTLGIMNNSSYMEQDFAWMWNSTASELHSIRMLVETIQVTNAAKALSQHLMELLSNIVDIRFCTSSSRICPPEMVL